MKKKQKIKEFDILLEKYKSEKAYVTVRRAFDETDYFIYGTILKFSKNYVLMQKAEEFYWNGYVIFPFVHLDAIKRDEEELFRENIMEKENSDIIVGIDFDINLSSWREILIILKSKDIYIIIECEELKESPLFLGKIEDIYVDSFLILEIDDDGKFKKSPTEVLFKDVTILLFGDRYIELYKKYALPSSPTVSIMAI